MMSSKDMIRVFIGFDEREPIAFSVLAYSINMLASRPVSIAPLMLSQLPEFLWRERHPLQSTDFAFSRFLVPYLCGFEGWAIFMDCDMLFLDDIVKLWGARDEKYAVMCVKHQQNPREPRKFLDQPQSPYAKKNWSSVMLLNCERCKILTPEYVNVADGLLLHRFEWLEKESLIGALPHRWNHLVDYDTNLPVEDISALHYTIGGPYFEEFRNCGYADLWFDAKEKMLHCAQIKNPEAG